MRRAIALGFCSLLPGALLLGGCYTILKHPVVSEPEEQTVGRSDRCTSCHSDAEMDVYEYGIHQSYYPDPLWATFYLRPWWYDDYSYYHSHSSGGGSAPPEGTRFEQGRGLGNKRPPLQPGVRVVPPGGATNPTTPPAQKDPGNSGGSSAGTKDQGSKDNSSGTPSAPEKQQQGQGMPNPRPRP